jgi:hypothetical protein
MFSASSVILACRWMERITATLQLLWLFAYIVGPYVLLYPLLFYRNKGKKKSAS